MWLISAAALLAVCGVVSWRLHSCGRLEPRGAIAAGGVVGALIIVAVQLHSSEVKRRADVASLARTIDLTATRAAPRSPGSGPVAASPQPITAAPVSSLVAGLERRLAEEPGDAQGWALLAQAYAFIGNDKAAQTAARRAVELGADEQGLRARVQAARRDRRPAESILHAFGG